MKKYILPVLALAAMTFAGCENSDQDFPDFDGGVTVYFSYQYPIRTIELGEDEEYSTELDNDHKFAIKSTMGGAYDNKDITVTVGVADSLCNRLYNAVTQEPIKPMPSNYYTVLNTEMKYENMMGACMIQLTDAFFADPAAINATYVIPIVMTSQRGADRIFTGTPVIEGRTPARTNTIDWNPTPKDYTLYCVRYVNQWNGTYLVKEEGKEIDKTTKRVMVTTRSLTDCQYTNVDGKILTLSFSGNNCTVFKDGASVGNGEFKKKSEIKSWGNKDRDALYLTYTVDGKSYTETLVALTRTTDGDPFNTPQTYEVEYK